MKKLLLQSLTLIKMKTLEFVKQDIKNRCEALANNYNINI